MRKSNSPWWFDSSGFNSHAFSLRQQRKKTNLDTFLTTASAVYDVAIFSSCKDYNGIEILKNIAPKFKFKFTWFRDRCKLDDGGETEFSTIKMISDILLSPDLNKNRHYSLKNIIVVDDSMMKHRHNPQPNVFIINAFEPQNGSLLDDNALLELLPILEIKFKELNAPVDNLSDSLERVSLKEQL